jgi:predicted amidohydrolase
MASWKIAGVQMDCQLGELDRNLEAVQEQLRQAARLQARLVIFPECVLTGYAFESKEEASPCAQPIPGPATEALTAECRDLGVWAVVGLLEQGPDNHLFNSCVLVGPEGLAASYRKIHLPLLGLDRFTTPGDRPFAVQEIPGPEGNLRIGMNICYDGSFPEASRVLTLLGADLIVLPTNWPSKAVSAATILAPARALENHVFYAGINRIGEERGFRFIGLSRFINCSGAILKTASAGPEILTTEIDPEVARNKLLVHIPGKYEIDRVGNRRPEMYGLLTEPRTGKRI